MRREDLAALLAREDHAALCAQARVRPAAVLRFLTGRLYSADQAEKWRAVRALGELAGDREITPDDKVRELLRRYFWALNDESGAVPYGIPEAIGEILARRRELQAEFLPLLCGLATDPAMLQTGPVERGVFWALGRVGPPVARCSGTAVQALAAAGGHPDPLARAEAAKALALVTGSPAAGRA